MPIRARVFEALGVVFAVPDCGDYATGGKVGIVEEVKLMCITRSELE